MKKRQVKALMVEPNERPKLVELSCDLDSLQKAVSIGAPEQGLIEYVYIDDNVSVLCNEEGKLIGLTPNRRLGDDILCGVFYVVADDGEGELTSLTKEQIKVYTEMFYSYEDISPDEVANAVFIKFFPEV